MRVRLFAGIALAAVFGALVPAPASDTGSLYDTLAQMKEHSILFVAVTEAKEATALRSEGPFTLFAPTDAAFKKLDDAAIKAIATDRAVVRKLLRAHLVEGKRTTKQLAELDGEELQTLQGGALKVEKRKDGFRVGGAQLVTTDIRCSNGVIHVIDTVLPMAKE